MANVDTHEEFWGITLTKEQKSYTWDPSADSEEDVEHKIQVTQACLGHKAKPGERNLIEVTTEDDDGRKITCPIVSLTVGGKECIHLELGFNNTSKFVLREGSGPLALAGVHLQALPLDLEDGVSSDSEGEEVPDLVPIITSLPVVTEVKEEKKMEISETDKKETAEKKTEEKKTEVPVEKVLEIKEEEKKVEEIVEKPAAEEDKDVEKKKPEKRPLEKEKKNDDAAAKKKKKVEPVKEESDDDEDDDDEEDDDDDEDEEDVPMVDGEKLVETEAKEDSEDEDSEEGEEPDGDDVESEDDDDGDDDDDDLDLDSDDDLDSDEEMDTDDDDDDIDDSDEEEEEEIKPTKKSKKGINGDIKKTPKGGVKEALKPNTKDNKQKNTPATDNKKAVNGKKVENGINTPKGKKEDTATPNTKGKKDKENKGKDTPSQVKRTPEELKAFLLKSPNLPKKYEKFANYMKNNMKVTDSKTSKELWDFVKKNKK